MSNKHPGYADDCIFDEQGVASPFFPLWDLSLVTSNPGRVEIEDYFRDYCARVASGKAFSSALLLVCFAYCLILQTLVFSYQIVIAAKRQETMTFFLLLFFLILYDVGTYSIGGSPT